MHRRNEVIKDDWPLLGDWYISPEIHKIYTMRRIGQYLAHKCADGKIGSVLAGNAYKSKRNGLYRLYGHCYYCRAKISKEVHVFINIQKVF